jgi:hypothetical protein
MKTRHLIYVALAAAGLAIGYALSRRPRQVTVDDLLANPLTKF